MKSRLKNLFILLLILFVFSCKEEDKISHPKVITLEPVPTSSSSCLFKGKVVSVGTFPILDYGFIYSRGNDINYGGGIKVSAGKNATEANYEKEGINISTSMYGSDAYYVRAYLTNEIGTVYGEPKPFTLPVIAVTGASPLSGKQGDKITIRGTNFSTKSSDTEVKFNETPAKIISVTAEEIVVEVPENISAGYYYNGIAITLKTGGQDYTVTSNFKAIPTFDDFSPKSGSYGTNITITGTNLHFSSYEIAVFAGDAAAYVSNLTSSSLTFSVPAPVTSTSFKVFVTFDHTTYELPGEFKMLAPTITSFTPPSGLAGSAINITGTNFNTGGYYTEFNKVKIGGKIASISHATATSITADVPLELPVGKYDIEVSTGAYTVVAADKYEVVTPVITDFTPKSGGPGTEVTITGTNLSLGYYSNHSLAFGNETASVSEWTATKVVAIVPYGIQAGDVKLKLTENGQEALSPTNFKILAPKISSFTPTSGSPGTPIVITGEGFNSYRDYNMVKFGTVETSIISATSTRLEVVVPSTPTEGAMKISVTVNGQLSTATSDFTVIQ